MDADFWDLNAHFNEFQFPKAPISPESESVSIQTLHDKLERLHSGLDVPMEESHGSLERPNFFSDQNFTEYKFNPDASNGHLPNFQDAQFPLDQKGIVVKVRHEPARDSFLSQLGETDSGFGDMSSISMPSALEDFDLDDVFKGWGDTMYHLLWKIVNPVSLYEIEGPDFIDEVDLLKLRASLYDTSECHLSNYSLPIPLPQFLPDQFEAPLLSPSQYFQPEDMMYQPISSNFMGDIPSSHLILGNILADEIVSKPEPEILPCEIEPFNCTREPESSPKRVKLWETKCDICGLVLLGGQQRFEAHVKNAHQLKCICGLDFKFKLKLTHHIRTQERLGTDEQGQHGITPGDKIKPLFECDFCDEIFRNRSAAVKHRNVYHLNIGEQGHEEKIPRVVKKAVKRKEGPPTLKRAPKVPKIGKPKISRTSISPWGNRAQPQYNGKLGIGKHLLLKGSKDIHALTGPAKSTPKKTNCSTIIPNNEDKTLHPLKPMAVSDLISPSQYSFHPNADSTNDTIAPSPFDGSKEIVAKINLVGMPRPGAPGLKLKKKGTVAKKRLKMPTLFNESTVPGTKSGGWLKYSGVQDPSSECEVSSTNNFFK